MKVEPSVRFPTADEDCIGGAMELSDRADMCPPGSLQADPASIK